MGTAASLRTLTDQHGIRDALSQLRIRLLDLTGRNRLLNYKHPLGKSLQFVVGDPSSIHQRLSDGKSTIAIRGLPEPTRVDWITKNGRLSRPEAKDWAVKNHIPVSTDLALTKDSGDGSYVRALMYADDLAKHCRKIERESILAIEETGANMLYLVLGFLEFPDQKEGDRLFTAPLISIPVVLTKKDSSGSQQFFLRFTGDDIAENISLKEKLRQDHGLTLPDLDDEDIDVEAYFSAIQRVIKPRVNFSLRRRISLCLLSFTNMLLVRDLDPDNWPTVKAKNGLLDHPIVKQVFSGNGTYDGTAFSPAEEHPVEEEPGKSIPLVFDADSSQHSALVDVLAAQKNLVIEGPPGTGKSQTIANLIAASIANQRTVLFVSEKLAALQVVKNRLAMASLDAFVLELHSTKSSKKQVLDEIARRCDLRIAPPRDLPHSLEQLESYRRELKAYADLLNSPSNSLFDLTLQEAMWRAERFRKKLSSSDGILTQISVDGAAEISEAEFSRRVQSLDNLAAQLAVLGRFDKSHPFWGFLPNPLVPGDEQRFERVLRVCDEVSTRLIQDTEKLLELVGVDSQIRAVEAIRIRDALNELIEGIDQGLPLHLVGALLRFDNTGRAARRELERCQILLDRYHALGRDIHDGLLDESYATQDSAADVTAVEQSRTRMGFRLGTASDYRQLALSIRKQVQVLSSGLEAFERSCQHRCLHFDESFSALERFRTLAKVLVEVPEEHIHIQSKSLEDANCVVSLDSLRSLQSEWVALRDRLGRSLYLDDAPDEVALKNAISVLREGETWYRFLQPKWRASIRVHKKLQREKLKMRSRERLADLHQLSDLLSIRQKWKSHPAWNRNLSQNPPDDPFPLEPYIAVARWNASAVQSLEEFGSVFFIPSELTPATARQLRRDFNELLGHVGSATTAIETLEQLLPGLRAEGQHQINDLVGQALTVASVLERYVQRAEGRFALVATSATAMSAHSAATERASLHHQIETSDILRQLLNKEFAGTNTNITRILQTLVVAEKVRDVQIPNDYRNRLLIENPIAVAGALIRALEAVIVDFHRLEEFTRQMQLFGEFKFDEWLRCDASLGVCGFARALKARVESALDLKDSVIVWSIYVSRRNEAGSYGLRQFVDLLETGHLRTDELSSAYGYSLFSTIVRDAFRKCPELGKFSGLKHSKVREQFRRLDREVISKRGVDIGARALRSASPPGGNTGTRVDDKTEMVLINHLMPQQRPRIPLRKLLVRAGRAVQALKPCFMMGPHAVAQYLSPNGPKFDLVVMDEASQLKPEEAIGAVARGGQLVVVGDPKQLPPTSFFSRMAQSGEDGEQFSTTDAESILDVCLSHFRPPRHLRWHYRSQHHSLIAFSNHKFYRNLVVFPSPYGHSSKLGVRATYISDAVYEDQTNYKEAV